MHTFMCSISLCDCAAHLRLTQRLVSSRFVHLSRVFTPRSSQPLSNSLARRANYRLGGVAGVAACRTTKAGVGQAGPPLPPPPNFPPPPTDCFPDVWLLTHPADLEASLPPPVRLYMCLSPSEIAKSHCRTAQPAWPANFHFQLPLF